MQHKSYSYSNRVYSQTWVLYNLSLISWGKMAVTKVRLSSDILSKVVTITVLFETTIIQLKPTADFSHCLISFNCLVIIYLQTSSFKWACVFLNFRNSGILTCSDADFLFPVQFSHRIIVYLPFVLIECNIVYLLTYFVMIP